MNIPISRLALLLAPFAMAACTTPQPGPFDSAVQTLGASASIGKGDFSSHANLEGFRHLQHLYALGPVQHMGGEVLVADSTPYAARVLNGHLEVTSSWNFRPPFLVYAQVARWQEIPIPDEVRTYAEVESWLGSTAGRHGIDASRAFAFLLRATPAALTLTVFNRPADALPGERPLKSYQTTWDIGSQPTEFVGFYSTRHAGVFLGSGERVHIHAITHDRLNAGHVKEFSLLPGGKLCLPY